MHKLATAILLALPLTAYAGNPNDILLRRRHHARAAAAAGHSSFAKRGAQYQLVDDYNRNTFFDMFDFFTAPDPTHGLVTFLDRQTAQDQKLAFVQDDGTIVMAVDDTTQLSPGQPRNSVRIQSKKYYGPGSLFIADFYSMPHGCSVWPAYWTVGDNWPNNGELDILEGVNEQTDNQITAHTGTSCNVVPSTLSQTTGRVVGTTCQSKDGANAGCNFAMDDTKSYGTGFNLNAGGIYAHTWDEDSIKVWFFPRQAIPADIKNANGSSPDPSSWGPPSAVFQDSAECSINDSFKEHVIVFDITLCGDWAGAAFGSSGCPGTCEQAVADPKNFRFAKFKLAGLRVYQRT